MKKPKRSQEKFEKNEGLFLIAKKGPESLKKRLGKTARSHINRLIEAYRYLEYQIELLRQISFSRGFFCILLCMLNQNIKYCISFLTKVYKSKSNTK